MNSKRTLTSLQSENISIVSYNGIESCETTQKTPSLLEYTYESAVIARSISQKANPSYKSYSQAETSCKCLLF
ncbi:unnamed protein product [Blepharisma stoltei]|uniref:Uncharacterized protein n=1 Tax=Blepharisma stoltei TaxID=1481888 RepID=A0AAU9K7H9_9CILI|nr:unnamed protein product [Blepharisma stoltei]